MLHIHSFTFNAFQENTYILFNERKQCWIIDPGMYEQRETSDFIAFLEKNEFTPQGIINTHAHIDHIFGVPALIARYNIPFALHKLETTILNMAAPSAMMYGFHYPHQPSVTFYIEENKPLRLGTDELSVFLTPGHSPGSISFYYPAGGWVIAGDVLFSGSIGRADLPGGDYNTLINAIKTKLFPLPDNTVVYSGHGPATTIGEEKQFNPFLQ